MWRSCEASGKVVQLKAGKGVGGRGQQKISGDNDTAFSSIVMASIIPKVRGLQTPGSSRSKGPNKRDKDDVMQLASQLRLRYGQTRNGLQIIASHVITLLRKSSMSSPGRFRVEVNLFLY